MSATPWLFVHRRSPGARARLICFPHAGGQPVAFAGWPAALPPAVDVLCAHLPGRGRRFAEPPITDRAALVEAIGPAIAADLASDPRPAVFLGHSMGGVLAFELCRWLAARGHPRPAHLVVVAHRAPHVPLARAPVHAAGDAALVAELRRLGGTPAEVLASDELMALFMPMIRADYTVAETWLPGREATVDVPILALGGWSDPNVSPAAIEAWRGHTTAGFDWAMFEGGHFFLHARPGALWPALRPLLTRDEVRSGG